MTDFAALGLRAGIEIHQQLDTAEKLFCRCPTTLRKTADHSGEFCRYLRATESEMGEIDEAAKEEMKHERLFRYFTYDTTCLVENDEEPPAPLNQEALGLCLVIAKLFGMTPVQQINTMRKLVIDGSNTSGFQRTALVALDGMLPAEIVPDGEIETICLEEEAAQRVEGDTFSLDRLGIPLVEITTSPCMRTPEEVARVAEYLGMVLRSTGQVKRGLGTIRQDVNISIREGARIEIKGVQELDLIAEVVRREVARQEGLLAIREDLRMRGAVVGREPEDVTDLFRGTGSSILKRAECILAVRLNGFAGLAGRELQPGRRLGSEFSDYAKKCGVGGIFHTDELPAYGITAEEVAALKSRMQAGDADCVVIVADTRRKAECAIRQVVKRAQQALEGVPEETRRMLEGGSTAYMRPLPGAARMYPETDVLPEDVTA
ncbi:MAG: Glu-tRNA(Gln) amidotransferase subunit GatE, partial [Methanoregulaceae archaeon]|nr:Glu-tRNA(Gln) amidotransferase subunit GatE [Methanoregulaceae archaeon]